MALILKLKLKGNYFEKQCRKTLLENVIFENKTWSLISWQLKQQKYTMIIIYITFYLINKSIIKMRIW